MTRSMPAKLRWSILKRDGFRCSYCGRAAADGVLLHVDHIRSWSDGGTDDPSNLTTACEDCNLGKHGESLPSIELAVQAGDECLTRLGVAFSGHQRGFRTYRYTLAGLARVEGVRVPPADRRLDKQAWDFMGSLYAALLER